MKRANDPNDHDAVAAHYNAQLQKLRALHGRQPLPMPQSKPIRSAEAPRGRSTSSTAFEILTQLVDAVARLVRIVAVSAAALFIIALALSGIPGVSR